MAAGIVGYTSRVLCMDANMALWTVVPELRARGFMASMAGLFPFFQDMERPARVDSLGIFVIGPTERLRMAYCPTVVGTVEAPLRRPGDELTLKTIVRSDGSPDTRHEWEIKRFVKPQTGPGYPLDCFEPKRARDRRAKSVINSCTPVHGWNDTAMQYIEVVRKNSDVFATRTNGYEVGWRTWEWPSLPELRQKPLNAEIADPKEKILG